MPSSNNSELRRDTCLGRPSSSRSKGQLWVALAYTGQLRTFSPRWQQANHLKMLQKDEEAIFHGFHADTFYVGPEDGWYRHLRNELLSLPSLRRVLLYSDAAEFQPLENDEQWKAQVLHFQLPPLSSHNRTLVVAEERFHVYLHRREGGSSFTLQGFQLAVALQAVRAAEAAAGYEYDAFVRLRFDVLLYAPFVLGRRHGFDPTEARCTLWAMDVRTVDNLLYGGRAVLDMLAQTPSLDQAGAPSGPYNRATARSAGVAHAIAGPAGSPFATLRIRHDLRCAYVNNVFGPGLPKVCLHDHRCNASDVGGARGCCSGEYDSRERPPQPGGGWPAWGAMASDEWTALSQPGSLSAELVTPGQPVDGWFARIAYAEDDFQRLCTRCEGAKVFGELQAALQAHGYQLGRYGEDGRADCPHDPSLTEPPLAFPQKARESLVARKQALLNKLRAGDSISIEDLVRYEHRRHR